MAPRRAGPLTTIAVAVAVAVLAAGACRGDDDAGDTLATLDPPSTGSTDATPVASAEPAPVSTAAPATTDDPTTTAAPTTTATTTTTAAPTTVAPTTAAPTTAAPTTTAVPPRPSLGVDGLGLVDFGAAADAAIASLSAALGEPTDDTGWVDPRTGTACPGTEVRIVQWGTFAALFGEPAGAAPGARQLVAYSYGDVRQVGAEPVGLVTPDDVGLGTSVADLRAAYPAVTIEPGEEGLFEATFFVEEGFSGLLTTAQPDGAVTVIFGGPYCA